MDRPTDTRKPPRRGKLTASTAAPLGSATAAGVSSTVVHRPKNLREVFDAIEAFERQVGSPWYRGCGRATYTLLPSLFRHKIRKSVEDFERLEQSILTKFRQRAIPFISTNEFTKANAWEQLFFMQHYAVPTRLLDWTESPLIGLYFALTSFMENTKDAQANQSAALWMLDPEEWNRGALSDFSFSGGILTVDDDALAGYRPGHPFKAMRAVPVMMHGIHNSARIVAQRGVFAVFGSSSQPIEEVYESQPSRFKKNILQKMEIEGRFVENILGSLRKKGITDSVIFPDLFGMAREIRSEFGFSS